jgi:hypothetical protein
MTDTRPGAFYLRQPGRPLIESTDSARPDTWICRRVVDYPDGHVPPGGLVDTCRHCSALVAYDPLSPVPPDTPKLCMQCAGIQPLPMTS